ncbi:hypothetical protein Tco_0878153 [Tanacetum coccineum]|uniref:Uncharacterized protein n=1 Tax=Tanacetum coccineum TaxID=301880 RepID=A0ABQ5BZK5_9ASTR
MLNPNPDTGIDSILNINTNLTSLVDVPVTMNVEMPPSFATTLHPSPVTLIQPLQQIPVSTPTIIPSTSLQNLPTFGSLFKFEDRVKALQDDFSSIDKYAQSEEPIHTIDDLEEPAHQEFDTEFTEDQPVDDTTQLPDCTLDLNEDPRESFDELMDTPLDFSAFVLNRLKVDTLTSELLADLTFELMKVNRESARDVYSRHRIIAITKLKIVEWHNYKHLDWITIHRNDDKLYTFKEGDYSRLLLQDIEDMLLLLVQGKLTNLNVEECLALGVSLRMFTISTVIRRGVEDLQLGVESYQKKLNLTRPDTYKSDLKHKSTYTAYSNPKGFIYQNKDKKNKLMRIDELHKFSDGTLNDVRSALDDILKRIRMEYLPQTVWRNVDRERSVRNPIKEILLKLNLPDHMSILTDSKGSTTSVLMVSPLAIVVLHNASPSVVQLTPVAERVVYVIIFSLPFVLIIPSSLCSHNLIDDIMSHTYGFPT